MLNSEKMSKQAAEFVDAQLQFFAEKLDGAASAVQALSAIPAAASFAGPVGTPLKANLEKAAAGIRSQHGYKLVAGAKRQLVKNPGMTIGIGAAAGALLAQMVVAAIKAENRRMKTITKVKPAKKRAAKKAAPGASD